ncbi:MAG: DNA methyltransferase [Armatimonadetes bacterium]|nr:DNA methyltransferase [Armatimonadota bacterium]
MKSGHEILEELLAQAASQSSRSSVITNEAADKVGFVARCISSRATVRLLMACLLAKVQRLEIDPRKPYTEIGGPASFSGRTYDETYITSFIHRHRLPCNPTTAFLTPALRNMNRVLTPDLNLEGRPREAYRYTLELLDDVHAGRVPADALLVETIRLLLLVREERATRMSGLLAGLRQSEDVLPLSSEGVVTLISQHLACKNASRLPVLVVAAAYQAASQRLGERFLPLHAHTAADEQTGALGDLEITLVGDNKVITSYEMKLKRVTVEDIHRAVQKFSSREERIDNYIFITTDVIEEPVREYIAGIYATSGGIEVTILDCIGFLRHFLHLFHRLRTEFLNAYQELLLAEPDSAVSQPLKEAFLVLRQAAESDE